MKSMFGPFPGREASGRFPAREALSRSGQGTENSCSTDRRGDQVWVVDVRTDGGFSAGKPRLLFEKPGYGRDDPIRGWDISPDGQRFLMVKLEERKPQPVTEMILVQNWFEELKRLVPTGKK